MWPKSGTRFGKKFPKWQNSATRCNFCPDLSLPKPPDQSKNVTVRTYHKLSREKNGSKKFAQKYQKEPNYGFQCKYTLEAIE